VPPVVLGSCFSLHDAIKQLFTACFCMNYWQAEIVDDHTIERKKLVSSSIAYFQKQAICTLAFRDWL
jgi:hypothetical protein